jgi:hypothetical protein
MLIVGAVLVVIRRRIGDAIYFLRGGVLASSYTVRRVFIGGSERGHRTKIRIFLR